MSKTIILFLISLFFSSCTFLNAEVNHIEVDENLKLRFDNSKLKGKISYNVFQLALEGYNHFGFHTKEIVIIDFDKASTKKRLYVIDLDSLKITHNTFVAHGKNTGANYAKNFSDEEGSHQSSLGFYRTAETYYGKHGYSLRLDGLEKGINKNARKRAIVIHGADYVSQSFINQHGRLGRSFGCPALPNDVSKQIIDVIKNDVCLFIYKNDSDYLKNSKVLNL